MIDWQHIDQLRNDLGPDGFSEIVDLFFVEVDQVFNRILQDGAHVKDMHFLKGNAANLGFVDFSKSCQIAQRALSAKQDPDLSDLFDEFSNARVEFEKGLAQRAA